MLPDEMQHSGARVLLEDLDRPVLRAMIGRDHIVDARVQMERDERIDDVRLIARPQRHDQLHVAGRYSV